MNTVGEYSSHVVIEGLLQLVRARSPIVDVTYGNGTFWKESKREVIGCDLELSRAKDIVLNFIQLPFQNLSIPTVIFDPPFHPYVNSAEEARFRGSGVNEKQLQAIFKNGLKECWRVASGHLIVKCQGYIHNHAPQWMPLWAIEICGEPFEWLVAYRQHKRISRRWTSNNSLRRNHADYPVFSKAGNKR